MANYKKRENAVKEILRLRGEINEQYARDGLPVTQTDFQRVSFVLDGRGLSDLNLHIDDLRAELENRQSSAQAVAEDTTETVEVPEVESTTDEADETPVQTTEAPEGLFDSIGRWWNRQTDKFKGQFMTVSVIIVLVVVALLALLGGGGLRAMVALGAIVVVIFIALMVREWWQSRDSQQSFSQAMESRSDILLGVLLGLLGLFVWFIVVYSQVLHFRRWPDGDVPFIFEALFFVLFVGSGFFWGYWLGRRNMQEDARNDTAAT